MEEKRIGEQEPTYRIGNLDYTNTAGVRAVEMYEKTGRKAQPWQEYMICDILAVNDDELWTHTKCGYSIPRRNGKGEVLTMRELYGLLTGEKVLHTAHRTTTSSSAAARLAALLKDAGYTELSRKKKGDDVTGCYLYSKQFGLERITFLETNGTVDFRTRSSVGGLGEGFSCLIIDEAQEYTEDQQSTLQYVVSDSANPQIILCGTPPTAVSKGTVFPKLRESCMCGETEDTFWAEWSVDQQSDVDNVDLWYKCNPAMGFQLNERKVKAEDKTDVIDFNIQRLGLWLKYNQKSAISAVEWEELAVETLPKRNSLKSFGIKFGNDGQNTALSVAYRTEEGNIFVETIACNPTRAGTRWLIDFFGRSKDVGAIVVDGASGQKLFTDAMKEAKIKFTTILPTVKEIINANSSFEQAIFSKGICHRAQPSLVQVVTNCDKRPIGSNGGFGYRSVMPDAEISILDSVILAHWGVGEIKEPKKQKVAY